MYTSHVVTSNVQIFVDDIPYLLKKGDVVILEDDEPDQSEEDAGDAKNIDSVGILGGASKMRELIEKHKQKKKQKKRKLKGVKARRIPDEEVMPSLDVDDEYEVDPLTRATRSKNVDPEVVLFTFMEFPEDLSFDPEVVADEHGFDLAKWPDEYIGELASKNGVDYNVRAVVDSLIKAPAKDETRARNYMVANIRDAFQNIVGSDPVRFSAFSKPWDPPEPEEKVLLSKYQKALKKKQKELGPIDTWDDETVLYIANEMGYNAKGHGVPTADAFMNTVNSYAARAVKNMQNQSTLTDEFETFLNDNWEEILDIAASDFKFTAEDINAYSSKNRGRHLKNLMDVATKLLSKRLYDNISSWNKEEIAQFLNSADESLRHKIEATQERVNRLKGGSQKSSAPSLLDTLPRESKESVFDLGSGRVLRESTDHRDYNKSEWPKGHEKSLAFIEKYGIPSGSTPSSIKSSLGKDAYTEFIMLSPNDKLLVQYGIPDTTGDDGWPVVSVEKRGEQSPLFKTKMAILYGEDPSGWPETVKQITDMEPERGVESPNRSINTYRRDTHIEPSNDINNVILHATQPMWSKILGSSELKEVNKLLYDEFADAGGVDLSSGDDTSARRSLLDLSPTEASRVYEVLQSDTEDGAMSRFYYNVIDKMGLSGQYPRDKVKEIVDCWLEVQRDRRDPITAGEAKVLFDISSTNEAAKAAEWFNNLEIEDVELPNTIDHVYSVAEKYYKILKDHIDNLKYLPAEINGVVYEDWDELPQEEQDKYLPPSDDSKKEEREKKALNILKRANKGIFHLNELKNILRYNNNYRNLPKLAKYWALNPVATISDIVKFYNHLIKNKKIRTSDVNRYGPIFRKVRKRIEKEKDSDQVATMVRRLIDEMIQEKHNI